MNNNSTNAPIADNSNVKEFLSLMKENHADMKNITAVVGYINSVERQLDKAVNELQSMRRELSAMRDERTHPLRTTLQNAVHTLETKIAATRERLDTLKTAIIDGCKNAVSAFKQHGISALSNISRFFRIKPALQALKNNIDNSINSSQKSIAKIETVSAEVHKSSRHIKNIGRALTGKEIVQEIKPNGKLAKLIEAPFKAELACFKNAAKDINKALAALEHLEKSAPKREKSSILNNVATFKAQIKQNKKDAPAVKKQKNLNADL
jgi:predicted  nucleic acid-binding Zn-ribbon protein